MMAADYRHIGGLENRLGRHYSRFLAFWPDPALAGQSLALRKLSDAGSNRRSRAKSGGKEGKVTESLRVMENFCSAGAQAVQRYVEVPGIDPNDMLEYFMPAFILNRLRT